MSVQLVNACASQKKAGPKSSATAGRAEAERINVSTNAPKSVLLTIMLVDLEMDIYYLTPLSLSRMALTPLAVDISALYLHYFINDRK